MLSYMYVRLCAKYPLFVSEFNENLIFSTEFYKKAQISNFIKIRPVGTEFFHADRRTDEQTDMTKLIVTFRNFCDRSEKDARVFVMIEQITSFKMHEINNVKIRFHVPKSVRVKISVWDVTMYSMVVIRYCFWIAQFSHFLFVLQKFWFPLDHAASHPKEYFRYKL
jgi:hypothetical protein